MTMPVHKHTENADTRRSKHLHSHAQEKVEFSPVANTTPGNFAEDEVGTPVIDTVLHAGDMLYFLRG